MINSGKCTQAIISEPEIRAPSFDSHMEGKQEILWVNSLRQAIEHTGNEQHMTILNWAHLQPMKGKSETHSKRLDGSTLLIETSEVSLSHVYCQNTRRMILVNKGSLKVLSFAICTSLKTE